MIKRRYPIVIFSLSFLLGFVHAQITSANALKDTQKIAADSLRANEVLKRVASENMANADSSGYKPKSVFVSPRRDQKSKVDSVRIKKIKSNRKRVTQKYDPNHPKANEKGYVTMPDVNPLVELMNIQRSKQRSERALKVYDIATDLRHKTIGLMSTGR